MLYMLLCLWFFKTYVVYLVSRRRWSPSISSKNQPAGALSFAHTRVPFEAQKGASIQIETNAKHRRENWLECVQTRAMVANSRETHFLRRGDVHFALDSRSRRALVSRFLASIASAQMMMVESTNASLAFDDGGRAKKKALKGGRRRRRTWRLSCTGSSLLLRWPCFRFSARLRTLLLLLLQTTSSSLLRLVCFDSSLIISSSPRSRSRPWRRGPSGRRSGRGPGTCPRAFDTPPRRTAHCS